MKHIIILILSVTALQDQISLVLCLKISFEWNQHEKYFSYLPALPMTATKDANMVLLFFPFFHQWEKFHIWFLHLPAGFFSVAYSSVNVTSMCLWVPLCLKKTQQTKHLLNLQHCWISPLYRIFLNWHINIYV